VSDYTAMRIDEMEAVNGVFRRARVELGVSSFGMSVQDHSADAEIYPDHAEPDQEEVYFALRGGGEIDIQGERVALDPSVMVRVGPRTRHKVHPGPEGIRLLALGGIPGRAYQPPDMSQIEIDGAGAAQPDYTVKRIEEMETTLGGGMRKARAELGVSSFGIQVLEFPPNADRFPEHDHAESGQEEVYLGLSGEAEIEVDGDKVPLGPEVVVRVGPQARRKIRTGDSPARLIALGAVPGAAFEATGFTELGEPDPLAG
jgi:mannose-6-phosphate isomerase-like protein (cupin superfamily)